MKTIPSVTVIVPAYNAASYISQTLESVLAQTFSDFEVIIVDDGSKDNTCEIAEQYTRKDTRIKLVRQANQGVGAARNTGINLARGKYVAPVDADDLWYPRKLEYQVALLEEKGDDWAMAYCWSNAIDADGEIIGCSSGCRYSGNIFHSLFHLNFIGNGSVPLFRTDVVRKLGGYITRAQQGGAQGCEDWHLMLNVAARYQAGVVEDHLVGYRSYGTSMSQNVNQMAASYEAIVRDLRRRNHDIPERLRRWSAGHFYVYLTMVSYCSRRTKDALRLALKAIRSDPMVLTSIVVDRVILVSLGRLLFGPNWLKRRRYKPEESVSKNWSSYLGFFDRVQDRRRQLLIRDWQNFSLPAGAGTNKITETVH